MERFTPKVGPDYSPPSSGQHVAWCNCYLLHLRTMPLGWPDFLSPLFLVILLLLPASSLWAPVHSLWPFLFASFCPPWVLLLLHFCYFSCLATVLFTPLLLPFSFLLHFPSTTVNFLYLFPSPSYFSIASPQVSHCKAFCHLPWRRPVMMSLSCASGPDLGDRSLAAAKDGSP